MTIMTSFWTYTVDVYVILMYYILHAHVSKRCDVKLMSSSLDPVNCRPVRQFLRVAIIAHRVLASFYPLDNASRTVECARIMEFPLVHSIKVLGSARTSARARARIHLSGGWQCYFSFERGRRGGTSVNRRDVASIHLEPEDRA